MSLGARATPSNPPLPPTPRPRPGDSNPTVRDGRRDETRERTREKSASARERDRLITSPQPPPYPAKLPSADFSETYKRTGPPPTFSPDGRYLATAVDHRCVIRDAESLEVLSISQCVEHIDRVEWSRDGDHVLCAQYRVGVVQCFSVSNDAWTCKIDEAAAGCVYARWTPCGTQIITVAEFNVRATAWSLVDRSCVVLDAPKLASADGFSFSPDGKFLAYARREACVDYVRVVSTKTWTTAADYRVATRCVHLTLVPIRPRRRGERRSLRTFPGASLRPGSIAFNPRPRCLSTPTDAFQLHPDFTSYGMALKAMAGLGPYAPVLPNPTVGLLDFLGINDPWMRRLADLECYLLSGVDASGTVAAEFAAVFGASDDLKQSEVRSIHWSPYDRVGVVNAVS